jgi:rhomboid protease GluP
MNLTTNSEDIVMKLLHYFITDKNYNPVVLYGVKNEIWLENLDSEYKIIRIVSNYIHNDEQLNFDLYRTKQIMKSIKKKTFSIKTPTLSLFVNLGDNVHLDKKQIDYITCINVKDINDVITNDMVLKIFPDINKSSNYKEEGMELFLKLSEEINEKTEEDAKKMDSVFKSKKPIVTYIILAINLLVFLTMYLIGNGSTNVLTLINFGANNRELVINYKEYYRLITSCFIHIGLLHLLVNGYSLYIIGSQVENLYGKLRYIIIYLGSAITGSLLSICFSNSISAGASGAIFGLLGALLYFGYHYRLYLGNALKNQIIPIIILNLFIGFISTGVDNACHVGGLIGGIFLSMACGVKYKSKKSERINGIILICLFVFFMIFLLNNI